MLRTLRAPRTRRIALLACLALTGTQAMPAGPATGVDLARLGGRWYIIARAPASTNPAVGAYFEYKARPDGRLDELYSARGGSFEAAPVTAERIVRADPRQPGKWTVKTGWFSSDEEWLLYVSADYREAIAGEPDGKAGWILAREPEIPEWTYAGLLARLAMQGYDVSRFRRIAQTPDQVGRPGFE